MEIVCINNSDSHPYLTIGKIYDTDNKFTEYFYLIKDDLGCFAYYSRDRFITLAEFRNKRINEILE